MIITRKHVTSLFPGARAELVDALLNNWPLVRAAKITDGRRLRFFLATVGVETGGLKAIEENLRYRAPTLVKIWPKHFRHEGTAADGRAIAEDYAYDSDQPYTPQAKRLAMYIYGTRLAQMLGNSTALAGWLYRGSGWIQTTGEYNFSVVQKAVGKALGLDFLANPDLLRTPLHGLAAALTFWATKGCNAKADANDVVGCRKLVNGGTNGLADFRAYLTKAARIIPDGAITAFEPQGTTGPMADAAPTDRQRASEAAIDAVQRSLDAGKLDTAYTGLQDAPDAPRLPEVDDGPALSPVAPTAPTAGALDIRDGVYNDQVKTVQNLLWNQNFKMVGLRDGKMGPNTVAAILAFRKYAGLPLAPTIDADLILALTASKPVEISPERALATPKDIRSRVASVRQAWKAKILALFTGGAAVVNQGVSYLTQPDNLETVRGTASAAKGWASDLGLGVWAVSTVALLAGVAAVWWYSSKGEASGSAGFKSGEITGQ